MPRRVQAETGGWTRVRRPVLGSGWTRAASAHGAQRHMVAQLACASRRSSRAAHTRSARPPPAIASTHPECRRPAAGAEGAESAEGAEDAEGA